MVGYLVGETSLIYKKVQWTSVQDIEARQCHRSEVHNCCPLFQVARLLLQLMPHGEKKTLHEFDDDP